MDYEELNNIVEKCINDENFKLYFDDLYKYTVPKSVLMIKENNYEPLTSNNFSIDYNLNDKLKLISRFLKELDPLLYNQFENIILSLDENQEPIVIYNKTQKSYVDIVNSRVYINLKNNLEDIFVILHEMIHCMNNFIINEIDNDNHMHQTYFKLVYNETAPIIAEKLFGQWLVKNNHITQNDLNLRINHRVDNSKECAKYSIMEGIYIKLKQHNIDISEQNLERYKSTLSKNSIAYRIIERELKNKSSMQHILENNKLMFYQMQKYILAFDMSKYFNLDDKGIHNFLELQRLLGDYNPKVKNINFSV